MACSGLQLHDNCVEAYNKLKSKHINKWVIFKINPEKTHIVVEEENTDHSKTYQDFLQRFPDKECKYAVFDLNFTTSENQKRDKPIFISWIPDVCSVKEKMIYSSTKDTLKKVLEGVAVDIQANDLGDLGEEEVVMKVREKSTAK